MDYIVGLLTGLVTFLTIGVCHPIVIKCEYHFGKECWPAFAVIGAVFCVLSVLVGRWVDNQTTHYLLSTICGVVAFSSFWSIFELFEQEKRVARGWFPANPKRQGASRSRRSK